MYRQGFAAAIALAWMALIAIVNVQPVHGRAGQCSWIAESVTLNNSTVMTPAECVALGGDCCNWNGYWNDGAGVFENPACMGTRINCKGCYKISYNMTC